VLFFPLLKRPVLRMMKTYECVMPVLAGFNGNEILAKMKHKLKTIGSFLLECDVNLHWYDHEERSSERKRRNSSKISKIVEIY